MASPASLPTPLLTPPASVGSVGRDFGHVRYHAGTRRIVTCPNSCRLVVLAQPPNSSGPKTRPGNQPGTRPAPWMPTMRALYSSRLSACRIFANA